MPFSWGLSLYCTGISFSLTSQSVLSDACINNFFLTFVLQNDQRRAAKVYATNCYENDHGPSCFSLGRLFSKCQINTRRMWLAELISSSFMFLVKGQDYMEVDKEMANKLFSK